MDILGDLGQLAEVVLAIAQQRGLHHHQATQRVAQRIQTQLLVLRQNVQAELQLLVQVGFQLRVTKKIRMWVRLEEEVAVSSGTILNRPVWLWMSLANTTRVRVPTLCCLPRRGATMQLPAPLLTGPRLQTRMMMGLTVGQIVRQVVMTEECWTRYSALSQWKKTDVE